MNSTSTIKKRFDAIGTESTPITRRDYREMLFRSKEGMSKYISGVILYDETIRQNAKDGTPIVKVIEQMGSIPGIKVDKGTKPLPFCPNEVITEGLDGLRERLAEYRGLGARFAKWRAVIDIGPGIPSFGCLLANAHALARYAALCQDEDIVPIVEPEVLMDGDHDIDRCAMVTEWLLNTVFEQLFYQRVPLEGMVLKPNMVVPGKKSAKRASVEEVAEKTLRVLKACVPAAVPGIAFLSGGQSRRGSHRASQRHQQNGPVAVAGNFLLRPRLAGGAAKSVVGQIGKRRRCPAGVRPPRQNERPRLARAVEGRSRAKSRVEILPRFAGADERAPPAALSGHARARRYRPRSCATSTRC